MGERRKTLNVWLKRTRDRGGVEGTRLEAKDTKKNIRGQRQPFREQTLSRARTPAQVFSKKIIIIRPSNFFFQVFSKKQNQKISQKQFFLQKTIYKILRIPKYCCSRAEDRAIFEDLKLRGRRLQKF